MGDWRLCFSKICLKVSNFPNPYNKVGNTQPGDRASEKIIQEKKSEIRRILQEKILVPQAHPGKDEEEDPYFKTV